MLVRERGKYQGGKCIQMDLSTSISFHLFLVLTLEQSFWYGRTFVGSRMWYLIISWDANI